MADVVSLRADGVVPQIGPEPEVIELLERWLERAKAGEIVSVGLICVAPNGNVGTNYVNTSVWLHHLTSGAATLAYRLQAENPSAND